MNYKRLKRQMKKADADNTSMKLYEENGFIDFTRFAAFFKKIYFKNNEARLHFLTNCYCMLFKKEA